MQTFIVIYSTGQHNNIQRPAVKSSTSDKHNQTEINVVKKKKKKL